jgi:hypothetical protein
MRTVITCDLCREDVADGDPIATLNVPETHPVEHDKTMQDLDSFMSAVFGRKAPTRQLHVCQGCVRGLVRVASQHHAAVRP